MSKKDKNKRKPLSGLRDVIMAAEKRISDISCFLNLPKRKLDYGIYGNQSLDPKAADFFSQEIGIPREKFFEITSKEDIRFYAERLIAKIGNVKREKAEKKENPRAFVGRGAPPGSAKWTVRVCICCHRKYEVGSTSYCMDCLL